MHCARDDFKVQEVSDIIAQLLENYCLLLQFILNTTFSTHKSSSCGLVIISFVLLEYVSDVYLRAS
jgi:hypothetical protein